MDAAELNARIRDDLTASNLAPEALAALGIDLDAVSARADELFGADPLREAIRLKHRPRAPAQHRH